MLKILWKRGEISPEEQFLLLSTTFCYLMLDFCVKTGIRFSLRDKRLFEITEVETTRVDCTCIITILRLIISKALLQGIIKLSDTLNSDLFNILILDGRGICMH